MRIRFGRNITMAVLTCAVLLASALLLLADDPPQYSPWSQAVKVGQGFVSPGVDDGCPFIAKNNLDLYFRSWVPPANHYDIYVSHRETVDDPWETPILLPINTNSGEICSFVSIDGHWLYFVSNRPGGSGSTDLWVSHRKDKRDDQGWEDPKNLGSIVNSSGQEVGPALFEDEATGQTFLYFTSTRAGGQGKYDIYVSTMTGDDKETFEAPVPVLELNTTSNDAHAFIRRTDGLEMIFFSDRPGGSGKFDLWSSTRPDTLSTWSPPVNLGSLVNSIGDEARPSISWDGTTLYFWSNRDGTMHLYMATRTKLQE